MTRSLALDQKLIPALPAPIQVAALTAYELDAELHDFLEAQRRILRSIGSAVHRALVEAGVRVHAPQGGFYLLLDFSPYCRIGSLERGIHNDSQLCDRLLADSGVALLPGAAFGLPAGSFTARLAYVDFDGEAALRDADRIEATASNSRLKCWKALAACERLAPLAGKQQINAEQQRAGSSSSVQRPAD